MEPINSANEPTEVQQTSLNNDQPNITQTHQLPPVPSQSFQPPKNKNKLARVLGFALVAFIIGAAVGGYYLKKELDSKSQAVNSSVAGKAAADKELRQAQEKIRQLDNPAIKINDAKRTADLGLFISAVKQYRTVTKDFPTTEPTLFKQEFGSKYLAKIPNFVDPNTKQTYEVIPVAKVQTPPGLTLGTIQYQWPGTCAGSEFKDVDDDTKAAARVLFETGETYCQNI